MYEKFLLKNKSGNDVILTYWEQELSYFLNCFIFVDKLPYPKILRIILCNILYKYKKAK